MTAPAENHADSPVRLVGRTGRIWTIADPGPPPSKLSPFQQREARARLAAGDALVDIARTCGVSHTTISRLR
ncbi:MAG: helix-turn-helix domain-containing protein [Pseudomonadota bacterium]